MKNKVTAVSIVVLTYSQTNPSERFGYIAFSRINKNGKGYVSTDVSINRKNYQRALLAQKLFIKKLKKEWRAVE